MKRGRRQRQFLILIVMCLFSIFIISYSSAANYYTRYTSWLNFPGNAYVEIVDSPILDFYQNNFTISLWIFPINISNNVLPRLIEKRSGYIAIMGNSSNSRYSKIAFELANTTGINTVEFWSNRTIQLNTWQNVVLVYSGKDAKWYINGIDVGIKKLEINGPWEGTSKSTSGYNMFIARRRSDLLRNFNGNIDEIRIYNRALSNEEINFIYNSGRFAISLPINGLIAWYQLDEGSGSIISDSSQYSNYGNITNPLWEIEKFYCRIFKGKEICKQKG